MIARLRCWVFGHVWVFPRDLFADVSCARCGRLLIPSQEYVAGEGWRSRR